LIGRVRTTRIGRITALTIPRMAAAKWAAVQESTLTPAMIRETRIRAAALISQRTKNQERRLMGLSYHTYWKNKEFPSSGNSF
jgi:hypothetical protein